MGSLGAALALLLLGGTAQGATLRVANAAPTSFFYLPLDAGIRQGLFARYGADVQTITLFGGGKGAQVLAAGSSTPCTLTDWLARRDPEAVRGFLAGWFDAVDWMRAHREDSLTLAETRLQIDFAIAGHPYDELMPMFSRHGRFPDAGLRMLAESSVQLGPVGQAPDLRRYVTESYLPAAS
jgi:ABC-type nitrate/sulfonate/bicarbonate transport system substrate-binding protein